MIAPATADDAAQAAQIMSDWIADTPWMPKLHSRDDDRAFCTRIFQEGRAYVAKTDGIVTGFLVHRDGQILTLYVDKSARGQGIGAALLDQAKDDLPQFTLWTFQANDGACRFYAREGLTEVQRTDGARNDEKLPDVQFSWKG